MFTHGALKSSWELVETCLSVPDRIGIWNCWFLRRGENSEQLRRELTTNSTHIWHWRQDSNPGHMVGGESSYHCVTLALHVLVQLRHSAIKGLYDILSTLTRKNQVFSSLMICIVPCEKKLMYHCSSVENRLNTRCIFNCIIPIPFLNPWNGFPAMHNVMIT